MYIDPFVAGILVTIMTELIMLIGFALFKSNKK